MVKEWAILRLSGKGVKKTRCLFRMRKQFHLAFYRPEHRTTTRNHIEAASEQEARQQFPTGYVIYSPPVFVRRCAMNDLYFKVRHMLKTRSFVAKICEKSYQPA